MGFGSRIVCSLIPSILRLQQSIWKSFHIMWETLSVEYYEGNTYAVLDFLQVIISIHPAYTWSSPQCKGGQRSCSKIDQFLSNIPEMWTPIFEWFMGRSLVRCESKNRHKKGIMCLEEIGLRAQNLLTILGSVVNISEGGGGRGGPIWPLNGHNNLHFDNEPVIHMNSINDEENGDGHNLDLLNISDNLRALYPTRTGCRGKKMSV